MSKKDKILSNDSNPNAPQPQGNRLQKKLDELCSRKVFLFALLGVSSLTVLGSTAIAPALPNLQAHFSGVENVESLSKLILTLPALFVVIFSPISGFLFDRFSRLRLIYPAMILWSLSGCAGFFFDNIYYILASRAVFGIATAFVMTGSSALIGDYYSGIKREQVLGIQGFFQAAGGGTFLILGGILSDLNWRFPFLVYLLGFVVFAFAISLLFEPRRRIKRTDSAANSIVESSQDSKIAYKFNFFTFLPIYAISFFGMAMFYISPTQLPFFITEVLQKSGSLIGLSLAISSVCTALSSLFFVRIRSRFNITAIYFIGFLLMGLGFLAIGVFHSYFVLLISLIFIGSTLGILLVTNSSRLFALTNEAIRARAYGFLASSIFMGQFLSPFITQPIIERFGIIKMFIIFGILILCISGFYLLKSRLKLTNSIS